MKFIAYLTDSLTHFSIATKNFSPLDENWQKNPPCGKIIYSFPFNLNIVIT